MFYILSYLHTIFVCVILHCYFSIYSLKLTEVVTFLIFRTIHLQINMKGVT